MTRTAHGRSRTMFGRRTLTGLAALAVLAGVLGSCSAGPGSGPRTEPAQTAQPPSAEAESTDEGADGGADDAADGSGDAGSPAPVTAGPSPSGPLAAGSGVGAVVAAPSRTAAGTGAASSGAGGGKVGGSAGFTWSVAPVAATDLPSSWRKGCPVGPSSLRALTLAHHSMDGGVRTGVLVVHEDLVTPTRRAFERLFAIGFPITSIRPVDEFGGDDDRSMAADNTSAFNCRAAVSNGPTSWSKHAYGRAIDVNPLINPYVLDGEVLPPAGARYTDRSKDVPGMITRGSQALDAFTDNGFTWGGTWSNPDYQHLQR